MKKYGIKGNKEVAAKGEILFETDRFEGVQPEQGVIYYLNADCTFEDRDYKKGYYKYTGTKFEPFGENGCGYGLPKTKEKITDYVWHMDYDHLDYIYAAENFERGYSNLAALGCTAIYKNGLLGRNLDWTFGKDIEAVVFTPTTLAVCGGIKTLTQEKMIDGTADKGDLKLLPFLVRDGMNNSGLACCINVVPSTGNIASEPTDNVVHTIDSVCLCRYILDNFFDAATACDTIRRTVRVMFNPEVKYELHYYVADKNNCYCLEFAEEDGHFRAVYTKVSSDGAVMTNFHIKGVEFDANNKVELPATSGQPHARQGVDAYGEGLERYNEMVDALPDITDVDTMFSAGLDNVLFTEAYKTNKEWLTEFVDEANEVTVDGPLADLQSNRTTQRVFYESFDDDEARREDGQLWHTTHSSVYDIENNTLRIKFNENTTNRWSLRLPFEFKDYFTVVNGEVCAIYEEEV